MTEKSPWHQRFREDYRTRMTSWSDIRLQMPLLYEAACRYDAPVIAELGTRCGYSTAALLYGASETGGHVWSVDDGPVVPRLWWEKTGVWSFLAADDMSDQAAQWVPAELDVLFIDTSHTYGHTLAELGRYVPRVRPGGVVLCHDVELRRDDEVMTEDVRGDWWLRAAADGPEFPVAAALDVYCSENGLSWERQPAPGVIPEDEPFYGLGTIFIPGA